MESSDDTDSGGGVLAAGSAPGAAASAGNEGPGGRVGAASGGPAPAGLPAELTANCRRFAMRSPAVCRTAGDSQRDLWQFQTNQN